MDRILVGTCSWTDRALLDSGWYPPAARDAGTRLRYYASRFPVVEVDATYYGLPNARNSALWAERTPDGFVFDVKAFSLMTGHPTRIAALPAALRPSGRPQRMLRPGDVPRGVVDEVWRRFLDGVEPLRRAGRLGTLLFQFPPWFAPGPRALAHLALCRERLGDRPMAVEFRHPDWWRPDRREHTARTLADLRCDAVSTDTVEGPVTPPWATGPGPAVVRFHGRSPSWGTGSKEDRFRYAYTAGELESWLPRIDALARRADSVHVLFNNCCGTAAVRAAETMRELTACATATGFPASG
ncbi:DUF72 domain-containing protein [Streptomyces sp. PTM05]|uniref:DUF72 domain-containing protein n=1 Tax=Streptantibioticus parmotrematis TaxID=2873249 RepID=A0ABS7QNT9_9ACTN|nr:DUF72 domain-containing protein [Streptantibioticus parmotrematis]MBY8884843.1 DUF72 domain-containing protein [Streptantibioticus parmotrematis]